MLDAGFLRLAALFCFTGASFGFLYFTFRYRRGSQGRILGIRIAHLMGFAGLGLLKLSGRETDQIVEVIFASLVVSLVGFEMANRFLRR